jgi:hypothetical protein
MRIGLRRGRSCQISRTCRRRSGTYYGIKSLQAGPSLFDGQDWGNSLGESLGDQNNTARDDQVDMLRTATVLQTPKTTPTNDLSPRRLGLHQNGSLSFSHHPHTAESASTAYARILATSAQRRWCIHSGGEGCLYYVSAQPA